MHVKTRIKFYINGQQYKKKDKKRKKAILKIINSVY